MPLRCSVIFKFEHSYNISKFSGIYKRSIIKKNCDNRAKTFFKIPLDRLFFVLKIIQWLIQINHTFDETIRYACFIVFRKNVWLSSLSLVRYRDVDRFHLTFQRVRTARQCRAVAPVLMPYLEYRWPTQCVQTC